MITGIDGPFGRVTVVIGLSARRRNSGPIVGRRCYRIGAPLSRKCYVFTGISRASWATFTLETTPVLRWTASFVQCARAKLFRGWYDGGHAGTGAPVPVASPAGDRGPGGAKPAGAGEAQLSAGPGATATNPPIGIRIVVFSLSRVGSPPARVVCFALLDVTVVRSSVQ